jgi:flavin reductase (DIM6/NTAB) family NADH-FMN oxidoreductase RutF
MCASPLDTAEITATEFKQAGRRFASSVTIVSTRLGEMVHGATVSAFCTLSLEPMQVMVSLGRAGRLAGMLRESGTFAISILAADQEELSRAFATSARPMSLERFPDCESQPIATGAPVLDGCLAYFDCLLESAIDSGDHTIFIGNVQAVGARDGQPLVYFDGAYRQLVTRE